jgi:hypothetical protein
MRTGRRSSDGRGLAHCDRTGAVCDATDRVWDPRAGWVRTRDADITPGFGTWHPLDHVRLGPLNDPRPIKHARPRPVIEPSKQDLGITEAEIRARLSQ